MIYLQLHFIQLFAPPTGFALLGYGDFVVDGGLFGVIAEGFLQVYKGQGEDRHNAA